MKKKTMRFVHAVLRPTKAIKVRDKVRSFFGREKAAQAIQPPVEEGTAEQKIQPFIQNQNRDRASSISLLTMSP